MNKLLLKQLIIYLFFTCLASSSFGQNDLNIRMTRYTIEDGLPNLTMRVIGKDSNGYVWLSDPLTRFDGSNFRVYSIKEENGSLYYPTAYTLADNGKGNLLFSGMQGNFAYDHSIDQVVRIPSTAINTSDRKIFYSDSTTFWDVSRQNILRIKLPNYDTTTIVKPYNFRDDNFNVLNGLDKLWTASLSENFQYLDLTNFDVRTYCVDNLGGPYITPLFVNEELWMVCNGGFWKYNIEKDTFESIVKMDIFNQVSNIDTEYDYVFMSENNIWVFDNYEKFLYKYKIDEGSFSSMQLPDSTIVERKSTEELEAVEFSDHQLLLGTNNMGLLVLDPEFDEMLTIDPRAGRNDFVYSKFLKPELKVDDNVFLACGVGQGLVKIEKQQNLFDPIKLPPSQKLDKGYDQNIRSILPYKNGVLIGTITDIQYYDIEKKTFEPFVINGSDLRNKRWGAKNIIADSEGNLLINVWYVNEYLFAYHCNEKTNDCHRFSRNLSKSSFYSTDAMYCDSNGMVWIGGQNGMYCINEGFITNNDAFNEEDFQWYDFKPFFKYSNDVHSIQAITEDANGIIWAGTSNGLFSIQPEEKNIETYFPNKQELNSISDIDIRAIKVDNDGIVWIGTATGGLNKFDQKNHTFSNYSSARGLPDNTIYSIEIDHHGTLWMGSNKGLINFNPKTEESHLYLPEDGVQSYEFNTNASCKFKDGRLAFGGINGLNIFHPDSIIKPYTDDNLVITSLKVNGEIHPFQQECIDLSYDKNFLEIDYSLLNFYKHDKVKYAYRLKGLESDWNYTTGKQTIRYPGLSSGEYQFQMKAAAHNAQWSKILLDQKIQIHIAWWNSWWFRIFLMASVIAMFLLFFNYKRQQQEHFHSLRNRISKDLHDEIGSTLSSISLFGTVAKTMIEQDDKRAIQMLNKINNSTTNVMESINDIVWAINAKNDKLNNLVQRIRTYTSELSDASTVDFSIKVDDQIKDTSLNMEQRRNVYLIFKEAINNAIKYSNSDSIEVVLKKSNDKLVLMIIDFGIGFNMNKIELKESLGGNGLSNMHERANQIKGKLIVNSILNKGTTITLSWTPK